MSWKHITQHCRDLTWVDSSGIVHPNFTPKTYEDILKLDHGIQIEFVRQNPEQCNVVHFFTSPNWGLFD